VKHSIIAVALSIAGAAVAQAIAAAQLLVPPGPPVDPNAQFDAASVKAFDANGSGPSRMMLQPGRLEANGVPLRLLLRQALRVQDYQIVGAPDWIATERYSIVAKAPEGAPANATPVMLGNLLKERFRLVTHSESRELPIFNLILARQDGRLGPNLKAASPECQAEVQARRGGPPAGGRGAPGGPGGAGGPGRGAAPPPPDFSQPALCGTMRIGPGLGNGGGQPMAQIVQLLAQFTGRPVYDKTGLTGLYDFELKWAPDSSGAGAAPLGPAPPGAPPVPVDPDAPNIYTAVQEQLGLKLESARGPVDVVVVDHIERPSVLD
jgi:uncharacterized protein (TIGR03435 family)